ncbi:GNAT family N-acetyltransferase [Sessilibacter corallicola]|uniref:GNAT family N-acetyltransferase n=1 Tax=Sessilibacter corallicola TaxID=2904075 RepID=A0ABQ0A6E4_9GAMM
MMEIKKITWEDTIPIRHQVLWPDKNPEFCIVEGDARALHYGIFLDAELVCVASIYISENSARLRKFATLKEHQNKGVGSYMLNYLLSHLKESRIDHLWFDARESVLDFYRRFGLISTGDRFYKSGVPYFKMSQEI